MRRIDYYMGLSDEERNVHLLKKHCSRYFLSSEVSHNTTNDGAELRAVLEALADSSGDGKLSCPEIDSVRLSFVEDSYCGTKRERVMERTLAVEATPSLSSGSPVRIAGQTIV